MGTSTHPIMTTQVVRSKDDEASREIKDRLLSTTAYSDPHAAVVREYGLNAIEAVRAAGLDPKEHPVRIELPSDRNNSTLHVTDEGVGLSTQEICEVFAPMVSSTKRDDTCATGELGIGAKSGYAVCDQILVTSVKDGVRSVVLMSKDEAGRHTSTVLEVTGTEQRNGTTVSVPVTDTDAVRLAATKVTRWWEPGTYVLSEDAFIPEPLPEQIAPGIRWVPRSSDNSMNKRFIPTEPKSPFTKYRNNEVSVVMGHIRYPMDQDFLASLGVESRYLHNIAHLYLEAPNKSLRMLPSRERLVQDAATRDYLVDALGSVDEACRRHDQAIVDGLDSMGQVRQVVGRPYHVDPLGADPRSRLVGVVDDLTFKGEPLAPVPVADDAVTLCEVRSKDGKTVIRRDNQWCPYDNALHVTEEGRTRRLVVTGAGTSDPATLLDQATALLRNDWIDGLHVDDITEISKLVVHVRMGGLIGWEKVDEELVVKDADWVATRHADLAKHLRAQAAARRKRAKDVAGGGKEGPTQSFPVEVGCTLEPWPRLDRATETLHKEDLHTLDEAMLSRPLVYVLTPTQFEKSSTRSDTGWVAPAHRRLVVVTTKVKTATKVLAGRGVDPEKVFTETEEGRQAEYEHAEDLVRRLLLCDQDGEQVSDLTFRVCQGLMLTLSQLVTGSESEVHDEGLVQVVRAVRDVWPNKRSGSAYMGHWMNQLARMRVYGWMTEVPVLMAVLNSSAVDVFGDERLRGDLIAYLNHKHDTEKVRFPR